jgi:hypothetical protein
MFPGKDSISQDELEYLKYLAEQVQQIFVARQSFCQHLAVKYKMGQNDRLLPDGTIRRYLPPTCQEPAGAQS